MIVPTHEPSLQVSPGTLHSLVEHWITSGLVVTEQIAMADLRYWVKIERLKSCSEFAERWDWTVQHVWKLCCRLGIARQLPPRTRARDVDIYLSEEEEDGGITTQSRHDTSPEMEGFPEEEFPLFPTSVVDSESAGVVGASVVTSDTIKSPAPTREEVLDYADRQQISRDMALRFFKFYDPHWMTKTGVPVEDWKAKLQWWNDQDKLDNPQNHHEHDSSERARRAAEF